MNYEAALAEGPVDVYADFFLPHLSAESSVLDVGCGDGALTIGLARAARHVTGVDVSPEAFAPAEEYVAAQGIGNLAFRQTSAELPFADDTFDAVFAHSVLEALARPLPVLAELRRVLRPGGLVGVASVDYGGIVLAGPEAALLRRFYAIRERLWGGPAVAGGCSAKSTRAGTWLRPGTAATR